MNPRTAAELFELTAHHGFTLQDNFTGRGTTDLVKELPNGNAIVLSNGEDPDEEIDPNGPVRITWINAQGEQTESETWALADALERIDYLLDEPPSADHKRVARETCNPAPRTVRVIHSDTSGLSHNLDNALYQASVICFASKHERAMIYVTTDRALMVAPEAATGGEEYRIFTMENPAHSALASLPGWRLVYAIDGFRS